MIPHKTSLTIGAFILLSAVMPHGVRPAQLVSTLTLIRPVIVPNVAAPVLKQSPAAAPHAVPDLDVPLGSLDAFYASLRRKQVTRILHYGDSPTTADSITSDVRRLLQDRFGDAGHGFVLIAKPWEWYGHNGIRLDAKGWQIEPASQRRASDGFHGLGGVSFRGESGAFSRVGLPDDQYARAVVYYLAQPGGGSFAVISDVNTEEAKIVDVNTDAPAKKPGFAEFALPPRTKTIELRVVSGKVRLFGYRFDKDQPGVQYSSLGINGGQVQMVLRYFEPHQWMVALRHEDPALVILNYGTNESIFPSYVQKQYPDELRQVIARVREALPRASLLLMGPMDRGAMKGPGGEIVTPESLEALIAVQKRVAAETGCAFFNTFDAMGGAGTMGRWYHAQPRLVSADFMHPLPAGAAKVGALFEGALMRGYEGALMNGYQASQ